MTRILILLASLFLVLPHSLMAETDDLQNYFPRIVHLERDLSCDYRRPCVRMDVHGPWDSENNTSTFIAFAGHLILDNVTSLKQARETTFKTESVEGTIDDFVWRFNHKVYRVIPLSESEYRRYQEDRRKNVGKPFNTTEWALKNSARDSAPASSTAAKSTAPARTSFDFYTVLPEIERVISETGAFETAPAAPKSESMPAESKSKASPGGFYMLLVGAYNDPGQAERMKTRLALAGFEPSVQHISVQGQGDFYRVRVGPYSSMDLMETANRQLAKMKIKALRLKVSRKPYRRTPEGESVNGTAQQKRDESEAVSAFGRVARAIKEKVSDNWSEPGKFSGLSVEFLVKVDVEGNVLSVRMTRSSGDVHLDESAEKAIFKASPLPFPSDPRFYPYLKEFNFIFKPDTSSRADHATTETEEHQDEQKQKNPESQSGGVSEWVEWRLGAYTGQYKGELKNGVPNGYGVFSVKRDHGDDYPWVSASVSGQWNDGVPQDMMNVTLEHDDDTIEIVTYAGEMNAVGQFHGYGVLTSGADRDASVVGTWKDDKPWNASILVEGEVVASFIEGEKQLKDESDRQSAVKERPRKLLGTGTGFVVNKDYVVTAEHVLEDCNAVSIVHGHREIGAQTAARDTSNDLGLLRLDKPLLQTAKLRGSPDLRVGDAAINYGYPLFSELSDSAKLNAGYVNSLAGYNNDSGVIQYSAPTQPGNSGGPVLDQSGNVIGVVSSGLSKRYAEKSGHIAQNVNFAIKSTILEGFLRSHNIPFEKANSTEKLELPDIAEKAERFTVLVGCWGQQSNLNYDKCLKLQIGKLKLEAAQRHCAPLKD